MYSKSSSKRVEPLEKRIQALTSENQKLMREQENGKHKFEMLEARLAALEKPH